jgi:hypothetical protein
MYKPEVEIVESFLQKKACVPDVPVTTDGERLICYGQPVARWDGDRLVVLPVDDEVVKGQDFARTIRRVCRNIQSIAKVRGLL